MEFSKVLGPALSLRSAKYESESAPYRSTRKRARSRDMVDGWVRRLRAHLPKAAYELLELGYSLLSYWRLAQAARESLHRRGPGRVAQHPRTRGHHGMFGRGVRAGIGTLALAHARLHVGNALGGERVAAQVGVGAAVGQPVGLLQLVEHAHEPQGVEPGLRHHAITDAVGFAFHVAREVQLVL